MSKIQDSLSGYMPQASITNSKYTVDPSQKTGTSAGLNEMQADTTGAHDSSIAVIYTKGSADTPLAKATYSLADITVSASKSPLRVAQADSTGKSQSAQGKNSTATSADEKFFNKNGYAAEWDSAKGKIAVKTCGVTSSYDYRVVNASNNSIKFEMINSKLSYIMSRSKSYNYKGPAVAWDNLPKSEMIFKFEDPSVFQALGTTSPPLSNNGGEGIISFVGSAGGKILWDKEGSKFSLMLNGTKEEFEIKSSKLYNTNKIEFTIGRIDPFNNIKSGEYSDLVEDAQGYLLTLNKAGGNYDLGAYGPNGDGVDGKWEEGGKTYAALMQFQQECMDEWNKRMAASKYLGQDVLSGYEYLQGVKTTGRLDSFTLNALKEKALKIVNKSEEDAATDKSNFIDMVSNPKTENLDKYVLSNYKQTPTLTVLVKQPSPGDVSVDDLVGNRLVGHTAVRLEYFETDSNGISNRKVMYRGFYPGTDDMREILLSIAGIGMKGALEDDNTLNSWNIGKVYEISYDDAKRVEAFINNYNKDYLLASNNCTDFVVDVMGEAGIKDIPIKEAIWSISWKQLKKMDSLDEYGKWVLEKFLSNNVRIIGYDPGDAGEQIRGTGEYLYQSEDGAVEAKKLKE